MVGCIEEIRSRLRRGFGEASNPGLCRNCSLEQSERRNPERA